MLILADADGFRVDLHQFGQRVLEPAGDRDRAAQGNVEVRELLRRQLGGRIHGCARFADDDLLCGHFRELLLDVEEEALGFTRSGTVAYRYQLNVVLFAQCGNRYRRFGGLSGMRVDGIGSHQFAGAVNDGDFYAGAQARIEPHGGA